MGGISDAKVLGTLREALEAVGLRNGMTISFHHHLRNGDRVLNLTMQAIAEMGIGDLTVASSAFFPVHRPIIEHIRQGTVSGLTGGCNGPIGEAV
ncbi:MAG: citrate lyase subunit alpha, partial [Clostridia bacterium]|nr:citrate lyase subunit alpha [Clostridia bacterium]